jgi:hypothetical protein
MLIQIAVGAFVIAVTIAIHGSMLGVARIAYRSNQSRKQVELSRLRAIMVLIGVIYWLLIAHLLEITIWALTFWTVDALSTFEESVYFAMVTSTSLGYGDITLDVDWRITGALSSASGLILYGWSTAYLFEYMRYQRVSVAGLPEAAID